MSGDVEVEGDGAARRVPAPDPRPVPPDPGETRADLERTIQARDVTASSTPTRSHAGPGGESGRVGAAGRAIGVDGYEILGRLGKGAMSTTYRARAIETGEPCAIKISDFRGSPESAVFFIREVQACFRLRHPNIVRVVDFGESGGLLFLAMEWVEGGTLLDRLERGPLAPAEAVAQMLPLADALEHAASRKFVHRDIKPANILLARDGTPMLGDFGLAKLLAEARNVTFTQTGEARGTPLYMPPEVIVRGASADARADLYSLGATYYHALAGTPPFRSKKLGEVLRLATESEAPRLEERNPEVPLALGDVIRRLMRKDPAERFQTAAELAAALRSLPQPGR